MILDKHRVNTPVKRFYLKDFFNNQPDSQDYLRFISPEGFSTNSTVMESLPYTSSEKGVFCTFKGSLVVSSSGYILSFHITNEQKYQVLKINLETQNFILFGFQHEQCSQTLLLCEKRNLVVSAGEDSQIVFYNFNSGQPSFVIKNQTGPITNLFQINHVAFVGGKSKVSLIDLDRMEIIRELSLIHI